MRGTQRAAGLIPKEGRIARGAKGIYIGTPPRISEAVQRAQGHASLIYTSLPRALPIVASAMLKDVRSLCRRICPGGRGLWRIPFGQQPRAEREGERLVEMPREDGDRYS